MSYPTFKVYLFEESKDDNDNYHTIIFNGIVYGYDKKFDHLLFYIINSFCLVSIDCILSGDLKSSIVCTFDKGMFTFDNCSVRVMEVGYVSRRGGDTIIDCNSDFTIERSYIEIMKSCGKAAFIIGGSIIFDSISLLDGSGNGIIPGMLAYGGIEDFNERRQLNRGNNDYFGKVSIYRTCLKGVLIEDWGGTFVSGGVVSEQLMEECVLWNISYGEDDKWPRRKKEEVSGLVSGYGSGNGITEYCVFRMNEIAESFDGMSGKVISGNSMKTLHLFLCVNNTFIACKRRGGVIRDNHILLSYIHILHHLLNAPCSESTPTNCISNTSIEVYSSHDMLFQNAKFVNCSSNSSGGALYINGNKYRTTFTSCLFENCSTKAGKFDGGAIRITDTSLTLTSTNFTNCSASRYGGGIYFFIASSSPGAGYIQNCTFCNNIADKGGADLCYYYYGSGTLSNPFRSCVTYNNETCTSGFANNSYTSMDWLHSSGSVCGGGGDGSGSGGDVEEESCEISKKYVSNTSTSSSSCTSDNPC